MYPSNMITRDDALKIIDENLKNPNLKRHCLAVEAVMRALAKRFKADPDTWGIAGLLHDVDYEKTKDDAKNHTKLAVQWLREIEANSEIEDAILAHAWGFVDGSPQPKTPMEWSLYSCDELTGFIVAVALVKPDKKLASVTPESVLRKWNERSFAAGVDRKQIEKCEERLKIPLRDFIDITLTAMQSIAPDLGL
jgi:putative nucleotidyltransferase with HDIG domain